MMQEEIDNRYDVVVVGSGHNGLVAACYLAQAGKRVLVLEKNTSFGGATASHRIFPDYDAMLSRYSYLVSLLPHKIVRELGLSFQTRRRKTASFTPWQDGNGRQQGLVLSNVDESRSRESMFAMTGSHSAWDRYQEFLSLQAAIAKVVWPTVLEPMRSRQTFESNLKSAVEREAWNRFVERPLGEAIEHFVDHDALRGLLLTDGKIGVFTHAHDESLLQNRCFLYHVIGNETGEWCVPVGGMHSLVRSLLERCRALGVHLVSQAAVTNVSAGAGRHEVGFSKEGQERSVYGQNVLVNAGPRTFARIFGLPWEASSANEGSVVKINMLLRRLPKLKAQGISAQEAFAGSFHIDEGYQQMAASYATAARGELPAPVPGEVYCHTLTDNSILSQDLNQQGYHTLTLFGLDMPWRLFASDHDKRKQQVAELYLRGLNNLTEESFEDCLALDSSGQPCIELKTPQDLQSEIDLDQGNIFHSELSWFFCDDAAGSWGVETSIPGVFRAGSSALRGGAVSGIPGHNAAMCVLKNG